MQVAPALQMQVVVAEFVFHNLLHFLRPVQFQHQGIEIQIVASQVVASACRLEAAVEAGAVAERFIKDRL